MAADRRPAVGLGDLARALALCTTDGDRATAAAALGFRLTGRHRATGEDGSDAAPDDARSIVGGSATGQDVEVASTLPGSPDHAGAGDVEPIPTVVSRTTSPVAPSLDALAGERTPLPAFGAAPPPRRPDPLFERQWQRSIATHIVERIDPVGAVDIERLVCRVAESRPVSDLPRHRRRVLRHGVTVAIDAGAGMVGFRSDATGFVDAVRAVAGRLSTHVVAFSGTPTTGLIPSRRTLVAPFAPARPVLVISDLGLSGTLHAATPTEWSDALSTLVANGPVVVLTPWPPPSGFPIPRGVGVVTWDRSTSAHSVARSRA